MPRTPLIGYRIRTIRRKNGCTQIALARAAGISAAYLNLIEHNRRSIGGTTLLRLAEALGVPLAELTGSEENRVLADLDELSGDPLFADSALQREDLTTILGVAPNVANAMIALYRAYRTTADRVDLLSERISHDPFLSRAVHSLISHITSIRSFSEILQDYKDLSPAQREKFIRSLAAESGRLSNAASEIFGFLEKNDSNRENTPVADEVDDLIYDYGNYFASLETRAEELFPDIARNNSIFLADLIRYLEQQHKIRITRADPADLGPNRFLWDSKAGHMSLSKNLPHSSSRFELARLVARLEAQEAVEDIIRSPRLTSEAARQRAREALYSYCAGALIFPYVHFLVTAEEARYDIEIMKQLYAASWEQICHRLTTLRRPARQGIPFHLIRTDIAGNVSKRFSASGLQLPRYGGACPRWAIHHALLTPGNVLTQMARTPDDATYVFVARSVSKGRGGYQQPQSIYSIMLGCDVAYAPRMVYADGIDVVRPETATPVGITCRLCPHENCQQRAYNRVEPE